MFYHCRQVLIPIISLAANTVLQVLSFRVCRKIGLLRSVIIGFFVGCGSVLFLEWCIYPYNSGSLREFFFLFAANMVIYSALGYCYFHFINLGETARRIRILREIYDSGGRLAMADILQKYNAKEIILKRVGRLLNNRQIALENGRYHINSRVVLAMAKSMVFLKLLTLGKRSEFD